MLSLTIRQRHYKVIARLLFLGLGLSLLGLGYHPLRAVAQAQSHWTKPEQIPGYDRIARAPFLVADQNHVVHAFSYETNRLVRGAIYYRRWTLEAGWSLPVDILLPGVGAGMQTIQSVHLDEAGRLHLIFYVGDQTVGEMYYSRANAAEADEGGAWLTPVSIGPKAGPVASAMLVSDLDGNLVLVYGGQVEGVGVYEVRSEDGGDTWSTPVAVTLMDRPEMWPASIKLEVDSSGRIHAVWSLVGTEGVGLELTYSRWAPTTRQWSRPATLALREPGEYSINWPTLLAFGDELMLIYQDSFPATRWMRRSLDGGGTWTAPVRPFPHIGEYENAILLKDSADQLHLILGNRTVDPEIHGMWHSQWLDGHWTPLQSITAGPVTSSYDPSAPQAVVSQGNILLAVWWHNVRRETLSGAWYAYLQLDLPELPTATPITLSLVSMTPTHVASELAPTPTSLPIITPTPPNQPDSPAESENNTSPALPVFLGVVPVVLLIIGLLFFRYAQPRFK